ncbi:hypothetical protein [Candidatus Magnetominusculus xianensis]|uniref:Type IV pili twitching motility protein PilT n=1 Tax=Candidatus Magnetominusculus xianensis TaxID=1748249 RepID=A0ABR5SCV5_9BACT|nr:hypothetical protein [Candidatus Magnetominusculus xianensis]KWT78268.1 type IV pili twitching motility protein PilT [Candidatus Magnetominusculus xianensis]MBF0404044.1 hypothetical protein [Nitrospirota bacterium]
MKLKKIDVFDSFCTLLKEKRGSMLYLAPGDSPYIRIGDTISRLDTVAPIDKKMTSDFVNLLITLSIAKIEKPVKESSFNYESKAAGTFKVLAANGHNGYMLSISPIYQEIPELHSLDLPDVIKNLVHTQSGLILAIGKHNSGKSETLASFVDYINKHYNKRIIVMENPTRYFHKDWLSIVKQPFVSLTEVFDSSNTFERTISEASVLAIDGFSMYETLKFSLSALKKGLLVIAAIRANGGVSEALRLMIECFPENDRHTARKVLATTLKALFWQNLLPGGTAVVPVFEILLNDPVISTLIYNEQYHLLRPTMAAGAGRGMKSITQALAEASTAGIISKAVIERFREYSYTYYVNPVKEAYS